MARKDAKAHLDAQKADMIERRARVLELRRSGASLREIGAALGIAHETVRMDYDRAIADLVASQADDTSAVRAIELDRLDRMHLSLWPTVTAGRGDVHPETRMKAVMTLLRIAERRAKLLGLDAPVKSQVDLTAQVMTFTDLMADDGDQ